MLYIFCALHLEARPVIAHFGLKKEQGLHRFPQFCGDGIRLTLTGMGNAAASTAVGSVLTACPPEPCDLLLNLGTCYGQTPGAIYLINKIEEESSGRTFYPDMILHTGFPEAAIATANRVVKHADGLADMEASAIFQAANYFIGPHQMSFLKVVSDSGNIPTHAEVEQIMGQKEIFKFVETLRDRSAQKEPDALSEEYETAVQKLVQNLHCSATMEHELRQYLKYLFLEGVPIAEKIERLYAEGRLPCKDRQEGKRRFEELKSEWI